MVTFSYHAEQQKKRLTPRELAEITRVLEGDEGLNRTTKTKFAGKFVSKVGKNKRVVWEVGSSGNKIVLTVVSK